MPMTNAGDFRKLEAVERMRAAKAPNSWAASIHIRTAELYAERVRRLENPEG